MSDHSETDLNQNSSTLQQTKKISKHAMGLGCAMLSTVEMMFGQGIVWQVQDTHQFYKYFLSKLEDFLQAHQLSTPTYWPGEVSIKTSAMKKKEENDSFTN